MLFYRMAIINLQAEHLGTHDPPIIGLERKIIFAFVEAARQALECAKERIVLQPIWQIIGVDFNDITVNVFDPDFQAEFFFRKCLQIGLRRGQKNRRRIKRIRSRKNQQGQDNQEGSQAPVDVLHKTGLSCYSKGKTKKNQLAKKCSFPEPAAYIRLF